MTPPQNNSNETSKEDTSKLCKEELAFRLDKMIQKAMKTSNDKEEDIKKRNKRFS